TLFHAAQPEMAFLALLYHCCLNTYSIIADTQREIVRVREFYFQLAGARVRTGISNRFVTNPVDLITNNRMHLSRVSIYGKRLLVTPTFIDRPAKRFGQIVLFRS